MTSFVAVLGTLKRFRTKLTDVFWWMSWVFSGFLHHLALLVLRVRMMLIYWKYSVIQGNVIRCSFAAIDRAQSGHDCYPQRIVCDIGSDFFFTATAEFSVPNFRQTIIWCYIKYIQTFRTQFLNRHMFAYVWSSTQTALNSTALWKPQWLYAWRPS